MTLPKLVFQVIKFFIYIFPISKIHKEKMIYFLKGKFYYYRNSIKNGKQKNKNQSAYVKYVLNNTNMKINYIPLAKDCYVRKKNDPKILAYYLTQFSPCKENDEWWGKGVTEWNNVARAVPMYEGHYQPRLPGELGFYDLRLLDNMKRQVELANIYGIYGFCFYYYWFNPGKRLLETALDLFVNNIDFPFSLCWANESWTSKFDGTSTKILMEQDNSVSNSKKMIEDADRYFRNKNYIKVNNKNLFTVYKPSNIKGIEEVIRSWRSYCKEHNLPDLYLVAVLETGVQKDWTAYGFDATAEFQPGTYLKDFKEITKNFNYVDKNFAGNVYDYRDFVETGKNFGYSFKKLLRAAMPMWDNSARRINRGLIFENFSAELFKKWLLDIFAEYKRRTDLDEPIVYINAWNEWGEGAYLEPDKRYGYANLQAIKDAIEENRD